MSAIKSITPILLNPEIGTPSTTQRKGVFIIQEIISSNLNDRKITNLRAEVP
jgi:hypothetical protein